MTPTQAPAVFMTVTRSKRPAAWPALALALASAAAYAIFFALPYYVNDLGRFPLAEVAYGLPDPTTQWPHAGGGLQSFVFGVGALLTLTCAPFMATAAVLWAGVNLVRDIPKPHAARIVVSLLAIACATGVFAWLGSPLASALITRLLD